MDGNDRQANMRMHKRTDIQAQACIDWHTDRPLHGQTERQRNRQKDRDPCMDRQIDRHNWMDIQTGDWMDRQRDR